MFFYVISEDPDESLVYKALNHRSLTLCYSCKKCQFIYLRYTSSQLGQLFPNMTCICIDSAFIGRLTLTTAFDELIH